MRTNFETKIAKFNYTIPQHYPNISWALEFVLVEDTFKNLFKKTIMSKSWPFRGQWSHWWRWLYWGWWPFWGELGADDHQGRPRLPGKEAPLVTAANCNPSLPSLHTYICDVLFGSWQLKYSDRQYIWVVGGYWFVAGEYLHNKFTCWYAPKSTLHNFFIPAVIFSTQPIRLIDGTSNPTNTCKVQKSIKIQHLLDQNLCSLMRTHTPTPGWRPLCERWCVFKEQPRATWCAAPREDWGNCVGRRCLLGGLGVPTILIVEHFGFWQPTPKRLESRQTD